MGSNWRYPISVVSLSSLTKPLLFYFISCLPLAYSTYVPTCLPNNFTTPFFFFPLSFSFFLSFSLLVQVNLNKEIGYCLGARVFPPFFCAWLPEVVIASRSLGAFPSLLFFLSMFCSFPLLFLLSVCGSIPVYLYS